VLDWNRFCSDTIVQFVKMQAELAASTDPEMPRHHQSAPACRHRFDHFDLAEAIDFVSIESTAVLKAKSSELRVEIDMLRSLKKTNIRTPDGDTGFWVMEQKAGQRDLARRQLTRAAGGAADVHLSVGVAGADGDCLLPLAPAAFRHGKVPRRRSCPTTRGPRPGYSRKSLSSATR